MKDYWKENNIKKPQQVVVCAACKYKDYILLGARHWDKTMRQMYDDMDINRKVKPSLYEQGFIDQFGEFLTREEAKKIAIEAGQVDLNKCDAHTDLFSEDLY